MPDEINMNTSIYNGEPINGSPEQEEAKRVARRERRANLPKFRLAAGERFYIPRDKLSETHRAYFKMFDEMKKGTVNVEEETRSFMESVIFEAYKGEIYKLQEDYSISGMHDDVVHEIKKDMMTPAMVRKGLFRRRKPNYALRLCQKEAELESETENAVYRESIARQELVLYGEEVDTFEAVFDELKSTTLKGTRKKYGVGLIAVFKGIQDAYEQHSLKTLLKLINVLEVYISQYVRGRRRKAAYELIDRLVECFKREIEERKARVSDITVLRLISEILKCKRGVPELPAPQSETDKEAKAPWAICNMDGQVSECYESQNFEKFFVPPEEIENENGAELNELYELESEFYDSEDEELEELEENKAEQNEFEPQDCEEEED